MSDERTSFTDSELDEMRRLGKLFEETVTEMGEDNSDIPDTVLGVMLTAALVMFSQALRVFEPGKAVAVVAAVAYMTGRKAERTGLVHESGTEVPSE